MSNFQGLSIADLPAPLAEALAWQPPGLGKRERTRRQLLLAAVRVFGARGVAAATIQEIALVAGMTPGTVYNHFDTKDAIVAALAMWMAQALNDRILQSLDGVADGAQRTVIGHRRHAWLARESPRWSLLLLEVSASVPDVMHHIARFALADLRLGMAQQSFHVASEGAAMDLILGLGSQVMQTMAGGQAAAHHDVATATVLLRGLGMPGERAAEVACRPLPDFPPLGAPPRHPPVGSGAVAAFVPTA
ncbi:TetR/AcrR family transcriptional regulator [Ottowia sp.]|jgi:AcrR family transcriptional regulator|uniref:TetR/AcrR family transcriptional regulator n=1 Tax=Ottowia sp. TaxID=1898956 RepID=UPI0025F84859|nr:TetR/AcrR family transcriptional regulator [Ottowia sp.]MBK6614884.1 TetR/AcrR family transcriptional regulator [Ottowia sp.]MBK6745968.1 TetR/AcrR family transcriptional regulator [Ottowia sp.]